MCLVCQGWPLSEGVAQNYPFLSEQMAPENKVGIGTSQSKLDYLPLCAEASVILIWELFKMA